MSTCASYRYCQGVGFRFMQVLARVRVQGSYRYCMGLGFMQVLARVRVHTGTAGV